ncbi:hypothetical protein [Butyrivibrio sp. NC3005]|uniref:hypothetical protein n=1 Tax=Butyrivibrio sp. NC3005 TaxID=1280685 RepID=UPI00047E479E|nr:hypothetical protein [Butyrivibrio sp. NC3005]
MDQNRINQIIDHYMDVVRTGKDKDNDELNKWRICALASKAWEGHYDSFGERFAASMQEAGDMIECDNYHPVGGILLLCDPRFAGKEREVRDDFNFLLQEVGDEDQIRDRMTIFMDHINSMLTRACSNAGTYMQDSKCVMTYLSVLRPQDNFFLDEDACIKFATYTGFSARFKSKNFPVKDYYRMCRELCDVIESREDLLEMMEKRLEMEALHRKDSWIARVDVKHHVLAYDIIHYADAYGFYDTHKATRPPRKTADQIMKEQRRAELKKELETLKFQREALDVVSEDLELPMLEGKQIIHKKYGLGEVIKQDGDKATVKFSAETKVLLLPVLLSNGLIKLTGEDADSDFGRIAASQTEKKNLDAQIKAKEIAIRMLV